MACKSLVILSYLAIGYHPSNKHGCEYSPKSMALHLAIGLLDVLMDIYRAKTCLGELKELKT